MNAQATLDRDEEDRLEEYMNIDEIDERWLDRPSEANFAKSKVDQSP